MLQFYKLATIGMLLLQPLRLLAQAPVSCLIIDAITKEPVSGATISCLHDIQFKTISNSNGLFKVNRNQCDSLFISTIGYQSLLIRLPELNDTIIYQQPAISLLQELVFTANRGEFVRRKEAPVAMGIINSRMIQDTKPSGVEQMLNKISGVNMVNLGNEQHQMSIRQPMTTKSLFLYLEDGIPIRTTGLFNHNALLEMNMAATSSIEVIKGPSSALYGSEAIGGVVNFITTGPTATPVIKVSMQGNNIGYKRTDLSASTIMGKWGVVLSSYYAQKNHGFLQYSDFNKTVITTKLTYQFNSRLKSINSITWMDYYSDMPGGIDSIMFANHSFSNPQTFTYRKVKSLRYHSTFIQQWNENSKTTASLIYRNNKIGQNPAYRIKDDYRRSGNIYIGRKDLAHGEINESGFHSYSFIAQHRQQFKWKNAVLTGGISADLSPSKYYADYIRVSKDSINNKYLSFQATDSTLTDYATNLNNYAGFVNFEMSPSKKLRLVASLRYDYFHYGFNNHLQASAFSGSPDTINNFQRISPKLGITYNINPKIGVYSNYSQGFVPPQVTELYTGVKVPSIEPAVFYNYEIGGWLELMKGKFSLDASLYQLFGTNEIISVKLDDGTYGNQNTGRTSHRGVEMGLNIKPLSSISFRISGAYSRHVFEEYVEKGIDYSGNEMANAPNWLYNSEIWYKPTWFKGFRIGAELQYVGKYFADPQNTVLAKGYSVLNFRTGYSYHGFEIWLNLLNATNNYYSYITTKNAFGYSYQLAEPRNLNVGISYNLGSRSSRGSRS